MNKVTSPGPKRWHDILKYSLISLLPNVPGSKDNQLSKERLIKFYGSSQKDLLECVPTFPMHLKIILNSHTEMALKEKVHPVPVALKVQSSQ